MNVIERIGERLVFGKTTERVATGVMIFAVGFFLARLVAALIR